MIRKEAPSHPMQIFIAGDPFKATAICRQFCQDVGYCVTVTETDYVYTDGPEYDPGVIVGLINYPRFPALPEQMWATAKRLAERLREGLGQQSYSIQSPSRTEWTSYRGEAA